MEKNSPSIIVILKFSNSFGISINAISVISDFRFKNGTFLKAGKTLLVLAFGLTNSQEEIIGNSELIIHDIRMDKQQLYKLLSL